MNKEIIRNRALKFRQNIKADVRKTKNTKILTSLSTLKHFVTAKHVLFYYSMSYEVDTKSLIDTFINQKQLYLPVVKSGQLKAVAIKNPLELKRGDEGVFEPRYSNKSCEAKIDLVIIPGVAFTKKGDRLGMGKGYYDIYLSKLSGATRIALAYQEQIFEKIPTQSYDENVDIIVTDRNIYFCNP